MIVSIQRVILAEISIRKLLKGLGSITGELESAHIAIKSIYTTARECVLSARLKNTHGLLPINVLGVAIPRAKGV